MLKRTAADWAAIERAQMEAYRIDMGAESKPAGWRRQGGQYAATYFWPPSR